MAETEDHIDERLAKALAAWMIETTIFYLNHMFIRGQGKPFEVPKVKFDPKGRRPWFTRRLSLTEQRERFNDPTLYHETMERLLARAAQTGDLSAVREWSEKMVS